MTMWTNLEGVKGSESSTGRSMKTGPPGGGSWEALGGGARDPVNAGVTQSMTAYWTLKKACKGVLTIKKVSA